MKKRYDNEWFLKLGAGLGKLSRFVVAVPMRNELRNDEARELSLFFTRSSE